MAQYAKTYASPSQLVALLRSRGLILGNETRVENYLKHIGYYRFSAYLYPLLTMPKENRLMPNYPSQGKNLLSISVEPIPILILPHGCWLRYYHSTAVNQQKVYFSLCVIKYFLDIVSPNNDMTAKLQSLFAHYPTIDTNAMGIPMGWEQEPLWQ